MHFCRGAPLAFYHPLVDSFILVPDAQAREGSKCKRKKKAPKIFDIGVIRYYSLKAKEKKHPPKIIDTCVIR
jgi:hypothetical protein